MLYVRATILVEVGSESQGEHVADVIDAFTDMLKASGYCGALRTEIGEHQPRKELDHTKN